MKLFVPGKHLIRMIIQVLIYIEKMKNKIYVPKILWSRRNLEIQLKIN